MTVENEPDYGLPLKSSPKLGEQSPGAAVLDEDSQRWDLGDRATFLLALDELADRLWPDEEPYGGWCWFTKMHKGRRCWVLIGGVYIETETGERRAKRAMQLWENAIDSHGALISLLMLTSEELERRKIDPAE